MITEKLKTFLTDTVGLDVEQLEAAFVSDKEVELDFTGELYTKAQLDEAKENVKNDSETKKIWKNTGIEMAVKKAREELGLEFEGKTIKNLTDALSAKILADAKVEPNEKIQELKTSLEKLQSRYDTDTGSKEEEILRLKSEVNNFNTNEKLSGYLPKELKGVTQKQFITLMKSEGYEFAEEDGNFVGKLNGKTLKDPTERPLPPDQIALKYATDNNWIEGAPGRGGGSEVPGSKGKWKSMNEKMKYLEENKIKTDDPEWDEIIKAPEEKE